jgi:hypothetical protein
VQDEQEDEDEQYSCEFEDDGDACFGLQYEEEAEGELVEVGSEDEIDNQFCMAENRSRRGCLPGCRCEDNPYRRGCCCFSCFNQCSPSCGCNCSREKGVVPIQESEYVDIDAAIAQNEEEESVELVGPHIVEDGALFFNVLWSSGEETLEPLENLMDKDGTLTEKLVVYADSRSPKLDLAPYVKILVTILNGKRDIVSDSSES